MRSSNVASTRNMRSALISKILSSLLIVLILTIVIFMIIHLLPGDPVLAMLGKKATPEAVKAAACGV